MHREPADALQRLHSLIGRSSRSPRTLPNGRRAVLALAVMLTACVDEVPTAAVSTPRRPMLSQQLGEVAGGPLLESFAEHRFAQPEVEVLGAIRPGQPFQVRARVRAHFDTPDADVRITLPDLEDASVARRRSGPPRLPSAAFWRGTLGAGQLLTQTATVTVPAPGYYRVRVAVRAPTADYLLPDGRGVQNYNVHEEWLLVCRNGGRATGEWGRVTLGKSGGGLVAGRFRGLDCVDPDGAVPEVQLVSTSSSLTECEPEFAPVQMAGRAGAGATTSVIPPDDCDPPPEEPPPPPPPPTYASGHVYYYNYSGQRRDPAAARKGVRQDGEQQLDVALDHDEHGWLVHRPVPTSRDHDRHPGGLVGER
jgi:hypothetical protein